MDKRLLYYLGIVASILIIYVSVIPDPWWYIEGGEEGTLFLASVSPAKIFIKLFGKDLNIPAIIYGTYTFMLILVIPAILNVVGNIAAIIGKRNLSRYLISIGPGITILVFPLLIYLASFAIQSFINIQIPVVGETYTNISLKQFGYDINVLLPIKSSLTPQYWIGFAGGILLIVQKIGLRKTK